MAQSLRTARKPVVQARAVATRDKILRAAEVAFARYGFDGTSLTADILEPAGVSVGSFYHQFDNKADLLLAVLRERVSSRRSRVVELLGAADLSYEASVRVALGALLDDMETSPDAWRVQYRERQHPDPTISRAIEVGWSVWAKTARALVQRCFDTTPERADAAARLTVVVVAGLLRDYLIADPAERQAIRSQVTWASEFCAAGAQRIVAA